MIRLWGRNTSSNVMKVLCTLDELGLAYERIDVGGPFGGTGTPEYRALQPLGLVPALEDDGFALFESNAIMRYLCRKYAPASPLYPADPAAAAVVDQWLDFQQTALSPPATVFFIGLVRTPPEKRDNDAIAASIVQTGKMYAILDRRLATQDWIAGPAPTLADFALGIHAHRWFALDLPGRPDLPNLRRWYDRLAARPVFARHCTAKPI